MIRAHIIVSGLVQGVSYRKNTQNEARKLKITGWVRNLFSGKVEIVAEGTEEAVNALISWIREGPRFARVKGAAVSLSESTGEFKDFEIREYGLFPLPE
ncbi:MAG: acylphosphatase [bacterium]|nr:acylphosphatase [bacterium]MDZ4231903.1 acylphosphatase [Candidatus Pacearchaeota archaeon]